MFGWDAVWDTVIDLVCRFGELTKSATVARPCPTWPSSTCRVASGVFFANLAPGFLLGVCGDLFGGGYLEDHPS